jgi:hypothetical protein
VVLIQIVESARNGMTREELMVRYPGIEPDLAAVDEWMRVAVSYRPTTEPMRRFSQRAQDLLDTYPKFPKDKARTDRIIKALRSGAIPWPIFVDTEDDFIIEGRHRIVAFHVLGLTEVPVVYVSKVA